VDLLLLDRLLRRNEKGTNVTTETALWLIGYLEEQWRALDAKRRETEYPASERILDVQLKIEKAMKEVQPYAIS